MISALAFLPRLDVILGSIILSTMDYIGITFEYFLQNFGLFEKFLHRNIQYRW